MAEKKLRVHNLAKELLVPSKVIIEKCRDEGIELKNHMHVVTAGLAATIREWFSEGAHSTTIEESKRVNLSAVRVKRKTKTKGAADDANVAVLEAPEAAAEAPPAEAESDKKKKKVKEATRGKAAATAVAEPVAGPDATETAEPAAPLTGTSEDARDAAATTQTQEPQEPAPEETQVRPGPQNIPKPAQLQGPRVVRIERPDIVDKPRPMVRHPRPPRGRGAAPGGTTLPKPETEERDRSGDKPRGPGRKSVRPVPDKRVNPRRNLRDTSSDAVEKLREWRDRDLVERRARLDHASGRGIGGLRAIEGKQTTRRVGPRLVPSAVKKDKVELSEPILIKDLSRETGIPTAHIQKTLLQDGIFASMNSVIDSEKAQLIAAELGIELLVVKAKTGLDRLAEERDALERKNLQPRPPVVTVLGHVDHGKTSLLDRIRASNVASGEAGGITQHVGAYRVRIGDHWVAFLDTPGHAAFTAMRARGANVTDVVVLVIAADDGVMPTTIEAINHARAAGSTIVVALNKIDLPHDLNKIYGQLAEHGLTPSGDWGGDTDVIKTSAVTGEGIDALLEHLATLSEVMELKADATLPAVGTVIEAERSGALGSVARVLVQDGTLKTGDIIVCGSGHGKVRALTDDKGRKVKKAGPSTPVEVTGLSDVPEAGDRFFAVGDAQKAKQIAEEIAVQRREKDLVRLATPTSLESVLASAAKDVIPELNVIIRADVQGSVDVIKKEMAAFPADEVKLQVLHAGVGTVTQSDIVLAKASRAIIVAFHVVPDPAVQKLADQNGVSIRTYRVIYNLTDDIRKALEGLLTPDEKIESRGRAEVRETFTISRVGKIAGCLVRDGVINRNHHVRLIRDSVVVVESATIDSLRRFKEDAKEVKAGLECGIRITGFDDIKPEDIIEAFEVIKVARKLPT